MNQAAKLINAAIIGADFKTVIVNNKAYTVKPPTIERLAGAGYYLSAINEGDSLREILLSMGNIKSVASALSWLIQGNTELAEELAKGELGEVVTALDEALSLVSPQDFIKLLALVKSVLRLTAKAK